MHLGIFAKTFPRPTLEETLDAIADRGLTHVQFNMSCAKLATLPERIDEDFCRSIARAFRERGLTMAAISGTFNLCDPNVIRLLENQKRFEVLAAACRWLDTRIITLCTGTRDPEDMWRWHAENVRRSTWDTMIGSMRQAVKIADRYEVTLAFEPELNNVVNSVSKARRLLDEIGSPWLKVVIDPANLARPGELIAITHVLDEALDWLGPDIVLAHVKEPVLGEADEAMWIDIKQQMLGEFANIKAFELILDEPLIAAEDLAKVVEEQKSLFDDRSVNILRMMEFMFYRPYLKSLRQAAYTGALIMHGLDESVVESRVSLLRGLLKALAAKG